MSQTRPSTSEYFSYFQRYVSLVTEDNILLVLTDQLNAVQSSFVALTEERAGFRYAAGKWSMREVLGHVIDAERVFGYRALCIARGEILSLPSFDENQYEATGGHGRYPVHELAEEFAELRRSHLHMFRHLDTASWERIGRVNQHPTSTRAIAFIMAGHVRHHANVLSERYGIQITA